ncbi:MAG TPA: class I SAM-dependent methyltransferase [Phycisphaeraceae bacterium]
MSQDRPEHRDPGPLAHRIYRVLDRPWVYRLAQQVLAPGAERGVRRRLEALLQQLPAGGRALDVGCGPASDLTPLGMRPVGVDLTEPYVRRFVHDGGAAVVGSATRLPFISGSFDTVWSMRLLHHLPDPLARQAIREMMRVCRPGGYVVILDATLPHRPWSNPLAYAIRRLDRGRYMRSLEQFEALLPERARWTVQSFSVAATRLPAVLCSTRR